MSGESCVVTVLSVLLDEAELKLIILSHHQGKPLSVRVSLVASLRPPQHPPLPAALLPHHSSHHCQHHGQVQCHKACGHSEG